MQEPIRVGLLGFGRTAIDLHAPAIEQSEGFRIVAVCDIEPEKRRLAEERLACKTYADYHAMLENEEPDLVCVLTRNDQHAEMSRECLEAGTHVLVTKPTAVNCGELDTALAASRRSGRLFLPWLPARWGCDFRRLNRLITEGAVGKVFLLRRSVAAFGLRRDWQTERRHGGGYLLNWGPHIVDLALLLGGAPVRSVYGRMNQIMNPGDTEDLFFALITLENGVFVQVEYTPALGPLPTWVVQGDRGTIIVQDRKLWIHGGIPREPAAGSYSGKPEIEPLVEEQLVGAPYGDAVEIYADVAAAVRNQRPFPVTPQDARDLTAVLDAIRLSAEEDRVVRPAHAAG